MLKFQAVMIVVLTYQLYLAVSTEIIDSTLKDVERVGSWPVQVLNIGLFLLVLGVCWLYLKSTRADLQKLQESHEAERKEYIANLKDMLAQNGKIIERNNLIFERIEKKLDRMDEPARPRPAARNSPPGA
jgi:uncharacterized coiled-coil protein SlyX